MSSSRMKQDRTMARRQGGFSLIEMMIVLAILLSVSAVVLSLMYSMTMTQGTVSNRTAMHSSVRSTTEVLQQEISQAGRIALPDAVLPVTLGAPVTTVDVAFTVPVSSTLGMFPGILLAVGAGDTREIVPVTVVNLGTNQITAIFRNLHLIGEPVEPVGGFPTGIVAPNETNGSSGTVLKMYGDINDDGSLVYVEYTCDTDDNGTNGFLYRNEVLIVPGAVKPAINNSMIMLANVLANDDGPDADTLPDPCFIYEQKQVTNNWYVVNVAVTLTVETEHPDPQTGNIDREKKALLNVSPRNIFEVWQMASTFGLANYLQPMPSDAATMNVASLLP